ncbi:22565_t:CDS:2, partial [Dentiscutata erythropus]
EKWGVRIDESTVSRILNSSEKRLNSEASNSNVKRHRSVTAPEVELALKEFVLNYQHKTILSDAVLIKKAKLLAAGLGVPEGTLQFSSGWLQKFKERNGIRQVKPQGEAASADNVAIAGNRAEDLKMNVLQAIRYTIQAWNEVTNDTIRYCWRHTNILSKSFNADLRNLSENIKQNVESEINDLVTMIENLNFSDPMQVEEFLNIPDENFAYEVPDDDRAIAELVEIFKNNDTVEDLDEVDEMDDSLEIPIVSADSALEGLET